MKTAWVWSVLCCLTIGDAAWAQTSQGNATSEKAVAALEEQWLRAEKLSDPDLLAPLLAERYVSTGTGGEVTNKVQALASM